MLLANCSCAANTRVVPNGSGSYIVAKQAATGFPGLGNLKAEALEEANRYCASLPGSGHQLFVTRSTETQPPYVLGNYPRAEIEFRCDAPSSAADAAVLECSEKHKRGEIKSFKVGQSTNKVGLILAYLRRIISPPAWGAFTMVGNAMSSHKFKVG
jgi:hypothetical protein